MMGCCCNALGSCEDSCIRQLTATGFFVQGEMPVCIVVSDNCLMLKLVSGWLVCSVMS